MTGSPAAAPAHPSDMLADADLTTEIASPVLDLPKDVAHALLSASITTVADVEDLTDAEIASIPGIDRRRVATIRIRTRIYRASQRRAHAHFVDAGCRLIVVPAPQTDEGTEPLRPAARFSRATVDAALLTRPTSPVTA